MFEKEWGEVHTNLIPPLLRKASLVVIIIIIDIFIVIVYIFIIIIIIYYIFCYTSKYIILYEYNVLLICSYQIYTIISYNFFFLCTFHWFGRLITPLPPFLDHELPDCQAPGGPWPPDPEHGFLQGCVLSLLLLPSVHTLAGWPG